MRTIPARWLWTTGWFVVIALLCGVIPGASWGQTDIDTEPFEELAIPLLTVTSEPAGAVVTLLGEYEWVGRTPWNLYREVSGLYRVEARLPGYDTWRGEVFVGPGAIEDLHIKMSRKSRFQAGLRSLIFPGWGQAYSGSKGKAALFSLTEVAALVGMVWTWELYQDDVDAFDLASDAYRSETDILELPSLRRAVVKADRDANRSHDRHKIAGYVAGGIYVLSFLDAYLFYPQTQYTAAPRQSTDAVEGEDTPISLGWAATVEPSGSSRVGLSLRF